MLKFKMQIFIPANVLYKVIEIEANNIHEAQEKANVIFKEEFLKTRHKNGNYVIEQI